MKTVYDLRSDATATSAMQRASRGPGSMGLRATHGLIGSTEWWAQIDQGKLQVHSLVGVVSGFWPGQWGDGPAEFEMLADDGSKGVWLCNMEPGLAKSAFRVGRPAEVRFVLQELKAASAKTSETKIALTILLGD